MFDRLKSDANFKNIPVIILTSESGKDHAVNIVKKGIKDYMVKPLKGQDMLERVRKIMPLEPWMDVEFLENWAGKYFTQFDDIVVMRLPAKITRLVSVEVEGSL